MTLKQILNELKLLDKTPHFFVKEENVAEEIPVTLIQSISLAQGPEIKKELIGYTRVRGEYDFVDCSRYLESEVKKASYGPLGENGPYRWTFVLKDE